MLAEIQGDRRAGHRAELAKAIKQTRAQFAYSSESVTDQGYWLGFSGLLADGLVRDLPGQTGGGDRRGRAAGRRRVLKRTQRNVGWYLPGGDQALPAEGDGAGAEVRMRRRSMAKKKNGAISALPGPDNILRRVLPNGITVLARENWSAPSVVVEGYSGRWPRRRRS